MHARLLTVAAAMIGLVALVGTGSALAAVEKSVTISPTSGFVGTVVTAKLRGAPPNDPITVIFKGMNDPVLATGTTDANGAADFTFTIPYAISGTYAIFFTDFKCSCQIATDFTVTVGVRTPTPVPTATPPATATKTATPTGTPVAATPTKALPTPVVPVLGTGGSGSGPGITPQPGLYGVALLIMAAGFAVMNAGQLRNRRAVVMTPPPAAPRMPAALTEPELEPALPLQLEERTLTVPLPEVAPARTPNALLIAAGGVAVVTALVWVFTRRR